MDRLKSPKPLNLDGNLLQNLKSWKQDSILFVTAIEYDKEPDNVKSNLLLHCMVNDQRKYIIRLTFLPQLIRWN